MAALIDVTVVLVNGSLPSTAMAPLEIFACAGTIWGMLMGTPGAPHFRVRRARRIRGVLQRCSVGGLDVGSARIARR